MRDAETVLGIIHDRGKRGLPLEDIYRQLYNPRLYTRAYDRLRNNKGAMTPGVTRETIDGMSLDKIGRIIEAVRSETYRWTPTKRVYIPKANGKLRPLGLPVWSDKLLQEVMRELLEAYYEPQFSQRSHGFRPNRSPHTALAWVERFWGGTCWLIEGDISKCFDTLDHEILLKILGEKTHDNRILRLITNMLKAGYLEDWKYNATYSGSPQGGVISPILSNIYLDKLDKYVEEKLFPMYNRGETRKENPAYSRVVKQIAAARKRGDSKLVYELIKQRRTIQSVAPIDPDYRRLKYVRYADDFLLGFVGPKVEAQEIKEHLHTYLQEELKLEMSMEKTLITHAQTEKARFLGYEIGSRVANSHIDQNGRRSVNGKLELRIPRDVVHKAVRKYFHGDKPRKRLELMHGSDYSMMRRYQEEYRGLVNFYLLARNIHALGRLHFAMENSLLHTLANKHKSTTTAIAEKYKATKDTPYGPKKCLRVMVYRGEDKAPLVAEFGGIPLRREKEDTALRDKPFHLWTHRTDLLARLFKQECEMCGRDETEVPLIEVHHIRKLANLKKKGKAPMEEWKKRMIAIRRKTLIVCAECHNNIHAGRPCRPRVDAVDTPD